MLRLSLASLRHQSRRFLAPGLAIVLGIAFVAATLVLTDTLSASMGKAVAGQYEPYSTVVLPGEDGAELPVGTAEQVDAVAGVASVDAIRSGGAILRFSGGERFAMITTEAAATPHPMVEGRAARAPSEVALSTSVATASDVQVGDRIPVVSLADGSDGPISATVVGIVDVGDDPRYAAGSPAVFATADGVTRFTGVTGWNELDVVGGSAHETEVTEAVRAALGTKGAAATVLTGTEHTDDQVAAVTGGTDLIGAFFLAFAVIALFVCAIVIGNTFSILLARRARETAMLRAIGSTRGQVVRSTLVEALVVGVVFSCLGVVAGITLARGLVGAGNAFGGDAIPELVMSVSSIAVVVPVLAGVVVVLVAALRPVLRSSRVAPLEALRPDAAVTARSRTGRVRITIGVLLLALGGVALVAGAVLHSVPVGVGGGLVSFTGVILAGSVIVPALARAIGWLAARPFGATGQLAVENAVRNPARAAATASALLVGVTLVTMTAVGAATTKSTITSMLDEEYPIDVVVQGSSISDSSRAALEDVDGVADTVLVPTTTVDVEGTGSAGSTPVAALPDGTADITRDPSALPSVADGQAVVSQDAAARAGLSAGDSVTLTGPDGTTRATVDVAGGMDGGWLVTQPVLDRLDSSATAATMYLRISDDADVTTTLDDVREIAAGIDDAQVECGAPVREANMQALDTALALLAVSVIIALVGIANTLSLSVIERTRESALMRALGLTRGQLRGMLAIEAALLAIAGVVLGIMLGTGYALAGVTALVGEFGTVTPVLPWAQLAAVAGTATVAALLASVLPARRAARVSPAAALAAE